MTRRVVLLHFGALVPPLKEQLAGQGLALMPDPLASFEKDAKALVRLHLHRLLTDGEVERARKKLLRQIVKKVAVAVPTGDGVSHDP